MHYPAPALFLKNISLCYGKQVVFNQLNLTLPANRWTCFLGQSGVGKSTLLKIIAGLIPNNDSLEKFSGEVSWNAPTAVSQQIAYMAQSDLLLPWLSSMDNAMLGARVRGTRSNKIRLEAINLFKQVDLAGAENKYPQQLSGGMRQRVALVRTLLENKPIVLMDEPFSAVDAITRFQLQTLAAELLKNKTVLFVTHDLIESLRLADDIYLLSMQPTKLDLLLQLQEDKPRALDNPVFSQYQDFLFRALISAKEKSQ